VSSSAAHERFEKEVNAQVRSGFDQRGARKPQDPGINDALAPGPEHCAPAMRSTHAGNTAGDRMRRLNLPWLIHETDKDWPNLILD
jgi:hypothetical protein